jgi:hypothetical protein
MIRSLRQFLADQRGTATIEFLFVVPTVMLIFTASFEGSFYTIRHVMLERSVDLVIRDIRLGKLDDFDHDSLKTMICAQSRIIGSEADCVDAMMIWMQPINTADFAMVAPPRFCMDLSADADPLDNEVDDTEFKFGTDNEIMLLRICLKESPMFPTTIVAAGLVAGGEDDDMYALVSTSVFVNEPG